MGGKILFVAGAIGALIFTYIIITSYWSGIVVPAVAVADNATDPATYKYAHDFINYAPLGMYFIPAFVVIVAIVWKLRQRDQP